MTYLDRLKTKISGKAPDPIATKATEAPFVPFVAPLTTPLRQISAVNVRSWGWRVTYPAGHSGNRIGGRSFECYIVPEQTLDQAQKIYPGAQIEPIAVVAA